MVERSCPACGAAVALRGGVPYAVCAYCQSLLASHAVCFEAIGTISAVTPDLSPLQLGTEGYFESRHFTLIGRVRRQWQDGSWNEWCALFDDQTCGWLAEAQGEWMMFFERQGDALPTPPALEQIVIDRRMNIAGALYTVVDIKQVTVSAAEGELPRAVRPDSSLASVELRGTDLRCATLEYDAKGLVIFTGRFVAFEECRFTHLRNVPGWGDARALYNS